jgi:8-oxo-dGTP pyrophosphatase MutT (NUDIX family)
MWIEMIQNYKPVNEQEDLDKKQMLQFINQNKDVLNRTHLSGHFTSSAIIVNETMTKVLFIHHNIYKSWGWVGGHNDGDSDFLHVAIKEAKEETGLQQVKPVTNDIIGLDSIYVKNHIKHGAYVPDHLHFNITYLLMANEKDSVSIKEDENSGVKWFDLSQAIDAIDEPRMVPIYQKLFNYVLKKKKELAQ